MDRYITLEATITPDNDAYTALDCIGGLQTINMAGVVANGGLLGRLRVVDDDNEGAALRLWLFDAEPSTIADDAALALSKADLEKCFAVIDIAAADYTDINSMKLGIVDISPAKMVNADGKGNIYAYLQAPTGSTPTYASGKTLGLFFDLLTSR